MGKLPKIVDLHIAPPKFMLAGAQVGSLGEPGEDRLVVEVQAETRSAIDPSLRGAHPIKFSFSLPVSEAMTSPLIGLQSIAYEAAADYLEAIVSELRKMASE